MRIRRCEVRACGAERYATGPSTRVPSVIDGMVTQAINSAARAVRRLLSEP
jgi:hypothetical protein